MHPRAISIDEYDYQLPDERIAKYPLPQRDDSKLLVYNSGKVSQDSFRRIHDHLPAKSLLVFNNSKVVECRMHLQKPTGGIIEVFALEPAATSGDMAAAMSTAGSITYKCLVGGAARWKPGQQLHKEIWHNGNKLSIFADLVSKVSDGFIIRFHWDPAHWRFVDLLHALGELPIPPYLNRDAEPIDDIRYQTIYARAEGSVAAPTAGLHFTTAVFAALEQAGVQKTFTTLHVGAGTFLPVKSTTMEGHDMHAEYLEATTVLLDELIDNKRIIPVGTTAMRTLETLYWMGVKANLNPDATMSMLEVTQWEPYDNAESNLPDKKEALLALKQWMLAHETTTLIARTSILIAPGYKFRICNGLVTNFHQPKSTLLLLVSALIGDNWHKVYDHALQNDFRFLSYGDSSLLLP